MQAQAYYRAPIALSGGSTPTSTPTLVPTLTPTPVRTATSVPTATFTPTSAPASYTIGAAASPSVVARGGSTTISVSVTSSQVSTVLVDLEVYTPSGTKIFQQYWDNQVFSAGQNRTFTATWQVPATAGTGTDTLELGIFSPGWHSMRAVNRAAGTVTITGSQVSTAPAATSMPTATATATKTATPTSTPASGGTRTLGGTTVGSALDGGDANSITGSRVVVGSAAEDVSAISVYVGAVDAAPYDQFAVAIYSDVNGALGDLVAQSDTGTLVANTWNSLPITAPLQPNTAYWLVYNNNGSTPDVNNTYYEDGAGGIGGGFADATFGTWPSSLAGATMGDWSYSIQATVTP
jgi:hypothetical protein